MNRSSARKRIFTSTILAVATMWCVAAQAEALPTLSLSGSATPTGPLYQTKLAPAMINLSATTTGEVGATTQKPLAAVDFKVPDFSFESVGGCSELTPSTANVSATAARALCPDAVVGTGTADFYLDQQIGSLKTDGQLTVFANGRTWHGWPQYLVHFYSPFLNEGFLGSASTYPGDSSGSFSEFGISFPRLTDDSAISSFSLSLDHSGLAKCSTGDWTTSGGGSFGVRPDPDSALSFESVTATAGHHSCVGTPAPPKQVTISETAASQSHGTVTSIPSGINCGSACVGAFPEGTKVTLTATPKPGGYFRGWGGECSGAEATCTVTVSQSLTVSADFGADPPSGPVGVSINDGARFTNDPDVSLSVVWQRGNETALVSNDGGFKPAGQFDLSPTLPWTLDSDGPEVVPKTVYLRFDGSNQTMTDDIILDQTPPSLRLLSASAGKGKRVRLKTKASDGTSGVAMIQAGPKKSPNLEKVTYRRSLTVKSSSGKLWVRVFDRAGNASKWKKVKVG